MCLNGRGLRVEGFGLLPLLLTGAVAQTCHARPSAVLTAGAPPASMPPPPPVLGHSQWTLPCRPTQPTLPPRGISYQAAPPSCMQLAAGEKLLQKASALPHLLPAGDL